jgi:hypothetical protein
MGDNAARRLLRSNFCLQKVISCADFNQISDVGRLGVDTIEAVIFWLAIVWTPGLAFLGYLVLRRPTAD